jgi:hypothetical protein
MVSAEATSMLDVRGLGSKGIRWRASSAWMARAEPGQGWPLFGVPEADTFRPETSCSVHLSDYREDCFLAYRQQVYLPPRPRVQGKISNRTTQISALTAAQNRNELLTYAPFQNRRQPPETPGKKAIRQRGESMSEQYEPRILEREAQAYWDEHQSFAARDDLKGEKFY